MLVLVLSKNAYNFQDKLTQRAVVGNSVSYTRGHVKSTENGEHVEIAEIKGNSEQVMKSIHTVPGVYEIESDIDINKRGQATLKLASAQFVASVDLASAIGDMISRASKGAPGASVPAAVPVQRNGVTV